MPNRKKLRERKTKSNKPDVDGIVDSEDDVGIDVVLVLGADEETAVVAVTETVGCAVVLGSTRVVVIVGMCSSAGVLNPDESAFDKRFTNSVSRSSKRPIR